MKSDPIVDEIHTIREKLSMQYGQDLHAICEAFRALPPDPNHPIVVLQPKAVKQYEQEKVQQVVHT